MNYAKRLGFERGKSIRVNSDVSEFCLKSRFLHGFWLKNAAVKALLFGNESEKKRRFEI